MQDWRELVKEENPEALFIGDKGDTRFDEAIMGIGRRCGQPTLVVYSYERIVEVLQKDGMDEDEAREYTDFNIAGAWMGEHTPLILDEWGEGTPPKKNSEGE